MNGITAATLGTVGSYLSYRHYVFGGSLTSSGTTNPPFQYVSKLGYYRHPGNVGSDCLLERCGEIGDFQGLIWNLVDNSIPAYTRATAGGFYGDGSYVHSGEQAIFFHNREVNND